LGCSAAPAQPTSVAAAAGRLTDRLAGCALQLAAATQRAAQEEEARVKLQDLLEQAHTQVEEASRQLESAKRAEEAAQQLAAEREAAAAAAIAEAREVDESAQRAVTDSLARATQLREQLAASQELSQQLETELANAVTVGEVSAPPSCSLPWLP